MAKLKTLTAAEVKKALKECEFFTATPKSTKINAAFTFDTHVEALVFIARITVHAEVEQHHPDITFSYCEVKVALQTHEVKGLTKKDIKLAKKIEGLFAKKSGDKK